MADETQAADDDKKAGNQVAARLARVLYARANPGKVSKDAWEAARADYVKQARQLMRALERQGLSITLAA